MEKVKIDKSRLMVACSNRSCLKAVTCYRAKKFDLIENGIRLGCAIRRFAPDKNGSCKKYLEFSG